ncbi:hypothetical protein M9H77_28473 [Catharanthus roseus]|uniref:Uncharacterized protein n=1 Tax=Catharanthus roseus TaxID=4058 RepID=A0ACC0AFP8_CATRO|nr:hypothetical protein M9H77_28473 [Catharanthus roseus]
MRVLSAAGKSERIKTHQRNFYTRIQRNMKCHSRALRTKSGSQNEVIGTKIQHLVVNTSQILYERSIAKPPLFPYQWSKQPTDSWGTYELYPGTNLSFKPLLALHKAAVSPQIMMRCPCRPIGPRPPRYYASLQVDLLSRV